MSDLCQPFLLILLKKICDFELMVVTRLGICYEVGLVLIACLLHENIHWTDQLL